MPQRKKHTPLAKPTGRYRPTPIAGLWLYPTALLLSVIVRSLEDGEETFIVYHPAFVPISQLRQVSVQKAVEWAEFEKQFLLDAAGRGSKPRSQ